METSDSEYFESADEEFSDDDEISTSGTVKPIPTPILSNLKYLSIKDNVNSSSNNNKSQEEVSCQENLTNKVMTTKSEKKDIQSRPKLGVKLGTKINKLDPTCTVDNENKEVHTQLEQSGKINAERSKFTITSTSLVSNLDRNEVNMWEDDEWEPILETTKQDKEIRPSNINDANTGWSGWGSWGVSSLLSTATVGVSTLTNHVSQGFSNVLESGMGVPSPEELARIHALEKLETTGKPKQVVSSPSSVFGLDNLVSGVSHITKLVETTSNKVISGGLDTLETIGKKTMEVLQEGDPGLKKKRAFLKIESDKPNLSHILREAKEKAETRNKFLEEKHFAKKANYELLFDDHQGLVHLEALEMLSKQCDIKLKNLLESQSGNDLVELQETLNQVNELCELIEEDDEESFNVAEIEEKLNTAVSEMNIAISYGTLITTWKEAEQWLEILNLNLCTEMELHEQAIETLAQLTAIAVEQYHKIGELLLIKEHRSTADEADSLVQLTLIIPQLISYMATMFSNKLNEKALNSSNKDNVNGLITNVYFEAANSSTYIKNAFQLLIPVVQVGAI